jgi:hypothetical protein
MQPLTLVATRVQEGKGTWSASAPATTGACPPDSPEAMQMVSSSRTSVTMAWKLPSDNGGAPVFCYEVCVYVRACLQVLMWQHRTDVCFRKPGLTLVCVCITTYQ